MTITQIIAQIIGIFAMAFNIISYQGKKQGTVIALQLVGGCLFAVNFLLLGAWVGGILNIIAVIRAVLFLYKKQLKTEKLPWFILFLCSYITVYILSFTVFGVEPTPFNFAIESLPVIGMTALNVGFRLKNASDVRKCGLISSPAWLIYNIVAGSWGAILCESFTLISIGIGMVRHDTKNSCNNENSML